MLSVLEKEKLLGFLQDLSDRYHLKWLAESSKKIVTIDMNVLDYIIECVAALPTQLDVDAKAPTESASTF